MRSHFGFMVLSFTLSQLFLTASARVEVSLSFHYQKNVTKEQIRTSIFKYIKIQVIHFIAR